MLNASFLMSRCRGLRDTHGTVSAALQPCCPRLRGSRRVQTLPNPPPPCPRWCSPAAPMHRFIGNYILKVLTNVKLGGSLGGRHPHPAFGRGARGVVLLCLAPPEPPSHERAPLREGRKRLTERHRYLAPGQKSGSTAPGGSGQ